jgi:hypothetical protein
MVVKPGDTEWGVVPLVFREMKYRSFVSDDDGATYAATDILDKRTGRIISPGTPRKTHLPSGAKSASSIARETAELIQLSDVAEKLDAALAAYEKSGDAGVLQGVATQLAAASPTGVLSLLKRYVGQWGQTEPTQKIVAEVQNFSNAVSHGLLGASLTSSEMKRLDAAVPSASDVANPTALRAKLKATQAFFEEKIKSAQAQGVSGPTGKPISLRSAAEARAAAAPKALMPGQTVWISGQPYLVSPDGKFYILKQ